MARAAIFVAVLVSLIAGGCRDTVRDGDLFAIAGKLFVFNYRVAAATYLVTLKPLGQTNEGLTAIASFEDPAGGEPIILRQPVWPKLDKQTLESPPVQCIVKDRPYKVSIRIEDQNGATLQTIETTLVSTLDQIVLPDKPLVVGPAYTPNPDLAGHPGGKMGRTANCPAQATKN